MKRSPSSPRLGGRSRRTPATISKGQVKRVVREVAGSGNQPARKGDVEVDITWKVELKATDKASMTISRKWVEKICLEALNEGMEPAIVVSFETASMPADKDWG